MSTARDSSTSTAISLPSTLSIVSLSRISATAPRWLPGITRTQPFAGVEWSTASHSVTTLIGSSGQNAASWCQSTGRPEYGGLEM
jgi:hypothetical protein